jgi:hypothetical protein
VILFNTEVRVFNLFKNPVPRGNAPMNSKAMAFCVGRLAQVKALSTKYRETKICVFLQYRGALGNWLLQRSKKLEDRIISGIIKRLIMLSGLEDPRIPVALAQGVSNSSILVR